MSRTAWGGSEVGTWGVKGGDSPPFISFYSYRSEPIGWVPATTKAWVYTVKRAMVIADADAATNIHNSRSMCAAKPSSQYCMTK